MKTEKLTLVQREYDLMHKHLTASNLSDFNKNRLQTELKSATIVKEKDLQPDTVCMESEVEIREVESGKDYVFQIVMPNEANMKEKKISVFAPVAIAILGYPMGSKVQWEMPNGLKTFEIIKVKQTVKSYT